MVLGTSLVQSDFWLHLNFPLEQQIDHLIIKMRTRFGSMVRYSDKNAKMLIAHAIKLERTDQGM